MKVVVNGNGDRFVGFCPMKEYELGSLKLDAPLTHSLIVVMYESRVLIVFDRWKGQWELPGGKIEDGESPRQCALRELKEESGQSVDDVEFMGLTKFFLQPDERMEYGALYKARIDQPVAFTANAEIERILWWDGGPIESDDLDEIDHSLIKLALGRTDMPFQ